MINEINRGNGITQLVEWPDQMEVKRIHVRRKHQVEESPLDDILFILSIILFTAVFIFAVPLVQWSELALPVSVTVGICLHHRHQLPGRQKKRTLMCPHQRPSNEIRLGINPYPQFIT